MVLPCLMTAFNNIGGSCLGWAGGRRIQTEATLLISYAENMENLRKQVQDLTDAIKDLEDRIQEAANRGATNTNATVRRLLDRMTSLIDESSNIIRGEEQSSDSTCLMGLRINLWACYSTSKSAKRAIGEALELLETVITLGSEVANVDYSKFLGVTPIEGFEEFESRRQVSEQIVAALKDPSVNKVGIYGMGGTGKTTLAEKIGANLHMDSTFTYVVLATVSEKQDQVDNNYKLDLSNIQKQIAGGFKIELQGKTLKDRTVELREQLQKKDKVLIIFDDIWSGFEFKDVGIPDGNVNKKIKILMTSRNEAVLLKEMNSKNNFGLDSLSHADAWTLFDRMVGGHIKYSNWRPTAEQVVKQCGGVPIILVTIAKSLRNEAWESWEDVLSQLKKFNSESSEKGVEEAYKMIEVSYKFLKREELQKLLLLCTLLNHRSIRMEGLLRYAMGLNLFKDCTKLKEVRNRLHRCISDLKGCCLLQNGNEHGAIKMHDVVHKFASSMAFNNHNVFSVTYDDELEDWPSKEQFEKFTAISLQYYHISLDQMLPAAFDNPKLESFLMLRSKNDASFLIADNFFGGMKGLKLMQLTRMSLSQVLVSSLGALVELRTLCLDGCELSDISVIGELPMLQVLSLISSSIVLVPKELGKLGSTLKLLDLTDCEKLERIEAGVISKLTLLEDLRIGKSFNKWKELEGNHKRSNFVDETNEAEMVSMEEFKNLKNLINLEMHIHEHTKMFPKDLVFKKLQAFKICFGSYNKWFHSEMYRSDYLSTRTLEVNESTAVEFDGEGSKALLTSVDSLFLAGVMSFQTVSEMDRKGFPELKRLKVVNAEGLQYIVKKNYNNSGGIFPKLERLDLNFLLKLERICDDHDHPLPIESFENLKVINVDNCTLLNHLFSSNLARGLLRLEEMRVRKCGSMENIIVSKEKESENEEIQIEFTHQLRVLELDDLPRLVSFCNFKQIEGLPSLITPLFNKKIMFPKLEELTLHLLTIEKIGDIEHLAIAAEEIYWFQNLTSLKVHTCPNLTYLFTSSMVKSLAKLKQLIVYKCKSIEEIVSTRKGEMEGDIQLSFPNLEDLYLDYLPNLKIFCQANLLVCQSLRNLTIEKCPELRTFVSCDDSSSSDNSTTLFTEKVAFSNIEELKINGIRNSKMICGNQLDPNSFSKLKMLRIARAEGLLNVFAPNMSRRVLDLEELEITGCDSLEKVFDVQILPMNERETCSNLRLVRVLGCQSLTSIFTTSLVPSTLQQLERLEVRNCDKIDLFGFNNTQQLNDTFAKVISSLKYCYLDVGGGTSLKYEHQQFELQIVGNGFQVHSILFALINSFPKLRDVLVARNSIITQLFPSEPNHLAVANGDDMDTPARIGNLTLCELSNMKQIWSEHFPLNYRVIPEVLEVEWCDSLLTLAPPSSTLFKNLTVLTVWRCPMLIRLVASSSTAKSLVNLKKMGVAECDSLEEIVDIDDQWVASNKAEYIVFEKLEVLELVELNNLTSFCSTSGCNFRLPSLTRVIMKNCLKMKFFSLGGLSAPNLLRVEDEDKERRQDEGRWEGDLNSTIRQLFEEKVTTMVEDEDKVEDNL